MSIPVTRTTRVLERIYADLIGPLPKQWLGKSYILTALDDYSRFCTAIPIKDKSEVSEKLKEWILAMEAQTMKKVANLQTDDGKEFLKVKTLGSKTKGISRKETIPYHEETHAAIERCGGANDGRTPNLGCTQEPRRKPLLHRRSCVRWRE